jgi:hypothetical protein
MYKDDGLTMGDMADLLREFPGQSEPLTQRSGSLGLHLLCKRVLFLL